ncbi:MAG: M48 family metalloprotease [Sphingomonadaceae bacterium]|nr:M48 family metalloprotease [Sphingomonadaceae bacterium]
MPISKNLLILGGVGLALVGSNVATPVAAQKKPAASVPKPFTAQEKSEGAKYHPEILKEFGGPMQSPQTAYVVRVGKNIALQSGLGNAESDFNVTLLNSSVNNAFAIPGGYVYITRQLVALCNSEAEMAGVLGHEVGHTAARHSKKRQKNATLANILGVGGTILGAVLGDNGGLLGALGGGLKQYSGTLAQVFSLKYSRSQEEEADDLGIRYLSQAGYDPTALSAMLNSLALQTSVDARVSGLGDNRVPEWASTHPDPARRVVRAANNARKYAANTNRRADTHLTAINGMLYGDDPAQGVVEGQDFLHPDIRMKFTAPNGFGLQNGTDAISINGNSGKAIFTQGNFTGDRQAYIAAALKSVSGQNQTIPVGEIRRTTVNGIPAFYASSVVNTQQGAREVTVFAYEWSGNVGYHFITISAANANPFGSMFNSMTRLNASQAASIKPRKLRVVTVGSRDSVASLAGRMAYPTLQTERFLALNGLSGNATLTAGQKVKIVTY